MENPALRIESNGHKVELWVDGKEIDTDRLCGVKFEFNSYSDDSDDEDLNFATFSYAVINDPKEDAKSDYIEKVRHEYSW